MAVRSDLRVRAGHSAACCETALASGGFITDKGGLKSNSASHDDGIAVAHVFAEAPHHAIRAGARLAIAPNAWLFASFDGEFSSRSQSYAGKGGAKVTW